MDDAVWAYSVTRHATGPNDLRGVAGEPVRTLAVGKLHAIVGSVPLADFGSDALKVNLENLDWLAVTAKAHDRIVRALPAPVVPLRLATVYSDDDSARAALTEHHVDFERALDFVAGRTELGVTGYLSKPVAPQEVGARPSGRDYLMARKRELEAADNASRRAVQSAGEVHASLLEIAVAGLTKPPRDPSLTRGDAMVHNGTYLVDDGRISDFEQRVDALSQRLDGIRLEVTGPWPPYSFVRS